MQTKLRKKKKDKRKETYKKYGKYTQKYIRTYNKLIKTKNIEQKEIQKEIPAQRC